MQQGAKDRFETDSLAISESNSIAAKLQATLFFHSVREILGTPGVFQVSNNSKTLSVQWIWKQSVKSYSVWRTG